MVPRHGANDVGAKLPATSAPRRQGLGVNDPGAMPLYLGVDDYGAKINVYFFKSFRKGHIWKNFSKKGLKNKKDGDPGGGIGCAA
jgi:hypothetical protein